MEGEIWKMGGGKVSTQKKREGQRTNHSNSIYKSYRKSYYLVFTYIYKYLTEVVPYGEIMPFLKL